VKSVDVHPTEPWVLSALYNGNVLIWDYSTNTLVKSFELCEVPVRCSKFITRKQWFIAGTDDMYLRVYNYNTMVLYNYSLLLLLLFLLIGKSKRMGSSY